MFRAYDVRGLTPEPLSPAFATALGRALAALGHQASVHQFVVGRDGRHSSAALARAVSAGLLQSGVDVIDIGLAPTPVLYYAAHVLTSGNGVMVTASHNPPDYNGFKVDLNGLPLDGQQWGFVQRAMEQGHFLEGTASARRESVIDAYVDEIRQRIRLGQPLKIVIDGSNGPGGEILCRVLRELGCEVECLGCEVDGSFPCHAPDPSQPGTYNALRERVRGTGADIGFMLDGDGDRLGVVDASGEIVWPDSLLMLFAKDVLQRSPGASVVFDVKCSSRLPEAVRAYGGQPVMWKSGHALTRRKMAEMGAMLAGEFSGHILCADEWFGFDDGIYAACRLARIIADSGQSAQQVLDALPRSFSTPEFRIDLKEGEASQVMARLIDKMSFGDGRVNTIDGIRVEFDHGWALVRASNTLPALTLRFEADSQAYLKQMRRRMETWVNSALEQETKVTLVE